MNIDFNVKRSEDCALIDTKKWVDNASVGITIHRLSGRDIPTGIAELINVHAVNKELEGIVEKGDLVLVSRVAADISQYRKFGVKVGDDRYANIPIMQIMGVFRNHEIDYSSLQMVTDKVLIKKIDIKHKGLLLSNDQTMFGEVVKVGTHRYSKEWHKIPLKVKVGDKVVVRDNVTTEVNLDGERYYAVEEPMIIGIFPNDDEFNIETLSVINNYILMKPHVPENLSDSILITPFMDYDASDYTEIYNRDLFKVVKADEKLDKITRDDILLLDRNITNYMYLGSEKYFVVSGLEFVSAKVK